MRILTFGAFVIGLGIVVLLVAWQGFGEIAAAFGALGMGLFLLPFLFGLHLLGASASWGLLFPAALRPPYGTLLRAIWIGTSVEAMLPAASLGAELAKARLLIHAGLRGRDAAPAVVTDVTVQGMVMAVWALIGLSALVSTHGGTTIVWSASIGAAVMATSIAGFMAVQHVGLFGLLATAGTKMLRQPRWRGIAEGVAELDVTLRAFYARPWRIVMAVVIRCCSRSVLVVELWLAARWMGHPVSVTDAAMLMGLIGTLRAATVVVPGGWGVQEGGYIVLGGVIGLSPEVMLALSFVTRARELMVGLPALLVWQIVEGRTLGCRLRRKPN